MKTSGYRFVFGFLSLAILTLSAQPLAEQQFADLGRCQLDSGQFIEGCRLGYRTAGTLNADKSNAILWPTWFTGQSSQIAGNAGPGKLLDPAKYFVIFVDAFGNGVSSSPSNSKLQPRVKFPAFTIRDMVRAEYRLVTEKLGIKKLYAVMGISMGGMQAFEWMATYPNMMDRAVPIVGSPQLAPSDITLWSAQADAIRESKAWSDGNYVGHPQLRAVQEMHQFALTGPANLSRTKSRADYPATLDNAVKGAWAHMDLNDYLYQLGAMLSHDITHANAPLTSMKGKIMTKLFVVASLNDAMVNPRPAMDLANIVGARSIILQSDCGHLATACDADAMDPAIQRFLAEK